MRYGSRVADDFDADLATRIRGRREELGLSTRAARDRLNAATGLTWPPTRWGKVEAEGRRVNVRELIGIAAALETTVAALLDADTAKQLCDDTAAPVAAADEERVRRQRVEADLLTRVTRAVQRDLAHGEMTTTEEEVQRTADSMFLRSLLDEREARVEQAQRDAIDPETGALREGWEASELDPVQLRGWATRRIANEIFHAILGEGDL